MVALLLVAGGAAAVVAGVFFWPLLPVGALMILAGAARLLLAILRAPGRAARRSSARNERARNIAMRRHIKLSKAARPPAQAVNPACGHTIDASATFCPACGAPTPNAGPR